MNNKLWQVFVLLASFLAATEAVAQNPSFSVGDTSGSPGDNVSVNVEWAPGASSYNGMEFRVDFDNTLVSFVDCTFNPPYNGYDVKVCQLNDANTVEIAFIDDIFAPGPIPEGTFGTINFTIDGAAAPQVMPLPINSAVLPGDPAVDYDPGQITIVGPAFSSNPAAGGGTEFVFGPVEQGGVLGSQNLVITNTGAGTLSGTCTETVDAGNVFTVTNGAYSAGAGLNDTVTVACSSAGSVATHTGQMSCTHNGGNVATPVVFDLSCQITAGPQPAFSSSNPAPSGSIALPATEQGELVEPSQTVNILNIGSDGTTLNGSCALIGPDSEIYLPDGGSFSVPKGGSDGVTVACDTATQNNFTNTLRCTPTNASDNTPVEYPVSCEITEAGAAVFASTPAPGAVDVDGGNDVVMGDDDPTSVLSFFNNADPGDQNLDISCSLSGDPQITVDPSGLNTSISPQGNTFVTFSCDTAASGSFTASYECTYANGGVDAPAGDPPPPPMPNAIYNLSCEVRDPESQVVPNPPDGTPLNTSVQLGGTATFDVVFPEINDEGEDGTLHGCSLVDGSNFAITAPASFPQTIVSGTSVTVTVEGTDPGSVESFGDTLTCLFSDSDDEETLVTYPINVTIGGGDARITVLKDFTDGNPGEVTVDLDCNTGLILDQEKIISEDGIGVTFVITDFDSGELSCNVTERPVDGYSADFEASGDTIDSIAIDDPDPEAGCYYNLIDGGDENLCEIVNSPLPVDVVIIKEWLYPGSADASAISDYFELEMRCINAEIEYENSCGYYNAKADDSAGLIVPIDSFSCRNLSGYGDKIFTVEVTPVVYPGGSCYVMETWTDPAVEVDNGCAGSGQGLYSLEVSAGSGATCTITNTVFFEGIPTLNQYGMALMALLMLGMGFVAVRRVV